MSNTNNNPTYYAIDEEGFLIRELGRFNVNEPVEADQLTKEQDGDWLAMNTDLRSFRRSIGSADFGDRTFALNTSELYLTEVTDADNEEHDLVYPATVIDEALKGHGF